MVRIQAAQGKRSVHLGPDRQHHPTHYTTLACGLVKGEIVPEAGDAPICQRCAGYAVRHAKVRA